MRQSVTTHNDDQLKPLILLADSQLLFYQENNRPYIRRLLQLFSRGQHLKAAYIGASNGDEPEFYQMFESAMSSIGIVDCKHITTALQQQELNFISQAHIILLAGGDVWRGWQTIAKLNPILTNARNNGAVLIGTSAGAIQLGLIGWREQAFLTNTDLFGTLGYIPAIFSAHEEKQNWPMLKQAMVQTAGCIPGIGIQSGAGLIITPDNHIQAVRKPVVSFTVKGDKIIQQPAWKIQLNNPNT